MKEGESKFKIYTKTGDMGTSGLIGGTRVDKSDERLEAYGSIDELNGWIGLILSEIEQEQTKLELEAIQYDLFEIGSLLATDISVRKPMPFDPKKVERLENEIDQMQEVLDPLRYFVLPGGAKSSVHANLARTVCRRAERKIVCLSKLMELDQNMLRYVNRLSDYLFVLSRFMNKIEGKDEQFWMPHKS